MIADDSSDNEDSEWEEELFVYFSLSIFPSKKISRGKALKKSRTPFQKNQKNQKKNQKNQAKIRKIKKSQ